MLAIITLSNWDIVGLAALLALYLSLNVRNWGERSVQRLVLVRVHYKDGTHEDIISFPWHLKDLFSTLEKNPLKKELSAYLRFRLSSWYLPAREVEWVDLHRFRADGWWNGDASLRNQFRLEKTLWKPGVRYWTGK